MPDPSGQTPVLTAAEREREGVVKLLLEREEVDPRRSTPSGESPLPIAVMREHSSVGGRGAPASLQTSTFLRAWRQKFHDCIQPDSALLLQNHDELPYP
ncbi:hypothetical protein L873DRAFT_1236472 [Choiromyces venosus 120613-1]|uniref:Uncharacterized protein n=1 Tax=Choiromyces venosus 120613-1 TaxID=1336337 RepID=A0A3N4JDH6_9PEZI|nr:hypothetical protein L873DRAFT_1236472 [Choiromyces venosus 120613-1]